MTEEKRRSELINRFKGLSAVEKMLLQLISLTYEPLSRSSLLPIWNDLPLHLRLNTTLKASSMDSHIENLRNLELITGNRFKCDPLISEIVLRPITGTELCQKMVEAVMSRFSISQFVENALFTRSLRFLLYQENAEGLWQLLSRPTFDSDRMTGIFTKILTNPFDRDWFCRLDLTIQDLGLVAMLKSVYYNLELPPEVWDIALAGIKQNPDRGYGPKLVETLILRGGLKEAEAVYELLPQDRKPYTMQGNFFFLAGEPQKAIEVYEDFVKSLMKQTKKRKIFLGGLPGIFYVLSLLQAGSEQSLNRALECATGGVKSFGAVDDLPNEAVYSLLVKVIKRQLGDTAQGKLISPSQIPLPFSIPTIVACVCFYWLKPEEAGKELSPLLRKLYKHCVTFNYLWLARSVLDLLLKIEPGDSLAKEWQKLPQGMTLADILSTKPDWEIQLEALMKFNQPDRDSKKTASSDTRLAWFLSSNLKVQPKEQTLNSRGWTKGKPIALKRLRENASSMPHLLPQDLKVISHIESYTENDYGWGSKTYYEFNESTLLSLIGHPLVFWEDSPTQPIELVQGELELRVKKVGNGRLSLQLYPPIGEDVRVAVHKESPRKLKVIGVKEEHLRLAKILGAKNKLEVPESAKEQVLQAIQNISQILTIHSDIGGGVATTEVPADDRIHIHLLPSGRGLRVAVLVRPFAKGGPYFVPGQGGETVIAEIDGQHLQTTRNLKAEKQKAEQTIEACPTLATAEQTDREYLLEDPESCLELLTELQTLGDEVTIEHPEGEKFRVSRPLDFSSLHVRIGSQQDWFAIEGELRVSQNQVIDMQQLLQLLEQTNHRFIPLEDGQFLALTKEFRQRLDELRTYGDRSGKKLKVHPLAAVAMEDWLAEVGSLKTNSHWQALVKRIQEIKDLKPQLPSTLQAELRDYQMEGYQWLARLAHWGVGACLADDMGLGKTLQALALILSRAGAGPSLVIAPTSVCLNWLSEASRFAPTLNLWQLGNTDRQKLISQLDAFDLLVCSYGLLQQDEVAEMLAQVTWQTIVLDEAQSIKNFATKRSQAAMNLKGNFRLLTTGTPIENHLGELWNLFRFINPGLLGSLETFNQRYAIPIERNNDKEARQRLKRLIQPFILRRTKNQVLQELPPRTEIVIQVELSREELAFYEALRRESLEQLSKSDNPEAQHLKVLAAIMRLRRACCHASLVRPEISLPSAKLQQFGEIITELLENRHKALVFSQFVDHLHLIENYLKEQNISYQYLDGSTPATERQKRVKAFQSGQGDVFLISLKAGGTGLNLTAADFVIHMDPWWNPAVEDQASDRAHRIGQQRPVTIYRLVAQGTIEEKIVKLHGQKRDLADSLLEGTEMSAKVSTEDLIKLIAEG